VAAQAQVEALALPETQATGEMEDFTEAVEVVAVAGLMVLETLALAGMEQTALLLL
jgi:hypothetical protein